MRHSFNSTTLYSVRAGRVAALAITALLAAACSSDSRLPSETALVAPSGSTSGTPADSTGNRPTGAVAGIRISPRTIWLRVGGMSGVAVYPVDASGVPTLALLAGTPAWTVGNSAVATINGTSGAIRGIAAGTTTIYATLGTYTDSATVTVVSGSGADTTGNGSNNGGGVDSTTAPPRAPVASFTLTASVFGRTTMPAAGDTSSVTKLAGANVSVYRLTATPGVPADTLGVRTLVGTVVADANGKVTFTGLPSGHYSVEGAATIDGAAVTGTARVTPPYTDEVTVALYLVRR